MVGATVVAAEEGRAPRGLLAGACRAAAAQDTEQHSPKHKRPLFASPLISRGWPHRIAGRAVGGWEDAVLRSTLLQGKHHVLYHIQDRRLLLRGNRAFGFCCMICLGSQ